MEFDFLVVPVFVFAFTLLCHLATRPLSLTRLLFMSSGQLCCYCNVEVLASRSVCKHMPSPILVAGAGAVLCYVALDVFLAYLPYSCTEFSLF